MKVKALFAGVVLAMGANGANAAIATTALNGVPSELLLSIHDYTTGRTFAADLGSSFEQFRTNTGVVADGTETWNLGALFSTEFSAIQAGITAGNDIRYNVVAMNRSTTQITPGWGNMVTSSQDLATVDGLGFNNNVSALNTFSAKQNTHIGALNSANGVDNTSIAINSAYTTTDPADAMFHDAATWGANIGGTANLDSEGKVGTALNFYIFSPDLTTTLTTDIKTSQLPGTWMLGANGSLTYSVVPVPGAVWLLGSALVGLVGLGNRKNKAA